MSHFSDEEISDDSDHLTIGAKMDSPPSSPLSIGPHSRSASPRRDANPLGPVARLSPWLVFFKCTGVQWDHLPSHANRLGVAVELAVDMTLSILDEDDEFEHLLQLREAIDLVQLALAVEPASLQAFLQKRSRDEWSDSVIVDEDAIGSVCAHGARYELRLSFEFTSIKTRLLQPQLARFFIRRLGQTLSTNEEFRALRRELIGRLAESTTGLNMSPIPMTVEIDSGELEDISLLDADDFFVYLTVFSETLVRTQSKSANSQWALESSHAPLIVTRINLSLRRFCITHRVVQAAKKFMAAGIPVECRRLNLDPRLISCADQDVDEFVSTLSQGSRIIKLETGACTDEELPGDIDDEGQDRRENIRVMMNAIARINSVVELDMYGIFTLCASVTNRREIIRCLFRQLLRQDSPAVKLCFDYLTFLTDSDADWFREESMLWRQKNPGKKLFAKSLHFYISNTDVNTVAAVVDSFDDAEEVDLSLRHGGNALPPRVIHKVMTFPSLKTLRIESAVISGMDLFDPSLGDSDGEAKPTLEILELRDVYLSDRESMVRFVQTLGNGHGLAKSLWRFYLTQSHDEFVGETYRADAATLKELTEVFKTNRVLREVSMEASVETASMTRWSDEFAQFNRTPLPSDLNTRRSAISRSRNSAFLSVMRGTREDASSAKSQLDSVLVNRILEFSSPHVERKVHISLEPMNT